MAQVTIRSQLAIIALVGLCMPTAGLAEPPPDEWLVPTHTPPATPGVEAVAEPPVAPEAPAPSPAPKPSVSLPDWLSLGAEYRVQTLHIQPLDLNGTDARRASYTEQRLRLDLGLNVPNFGVSLITQFDFLDGVLFGDNGDWGGKPSPSSGLGITSRWPNAAGWTVGLLPGRDPLNPDSYGATLQGIEPFRINRAYGKVVLPFGMIQVGRQPSSAGPGMSIHDGSRSNRWGVSRYAYSSDRFLFATKISELWRMIQLGKDYVKDASFDDGLFLALAYDWVVNDNITLASDDLHQAVGMLQYKAKDPSWLGGPGRKLTAQIAVANRFGKEFNTSVWVIPMSLELDAGRVRFLAEFSTQFGSTREISEGLAALRESDPARRQIRDQTIRAFGARGVLDVDIGPVTATLEVDFASGDDDPRDDTPLTTFNFAHDTNVGLLLFEHVLAFQSARSAAVGIENLRNLGSRSFPITELASEGRFHNSIALFPQVQYRPLPWLSTRAGVLMAWAAKPVVDPIMTLLNEDGDRIDDDAVNWNGGRPARYYGTEVDLQVEFNWKNHFLWTLEGAVLFPGAALRDESGDAVTSFMIQNRFTFVF